MIQIKNGSNYKVFEIDSESELKALCNEKQSTILGLDTESKKKFNLIEIQHQNTEITYGLICGGHGIEPSVTKIEKRDLAVISSDKSVYLVDLNSHNSIKQVSCESLVYDVFPIQSGHNQILIICELEVRCLSLDGFQTWRYDCDIINDFKLFENYMEIYTCDGVAKISLEDGSLL